MYLSALNLENIRISNVISYLAFGVTAALAAGLVLVNAQAGSQAQMLQEQLSAVDVSLAQADVSIGVLDLDTGERWFLNGNQRFPMQSVVKLPLAIAVLKLVDEGKLTLDQPVTVTRAEFAPRWSPMLKEISGDRAQFTVEDLLRRSLQASDNSRCAGSTDWWP
jgi:beta-lactamase class A